MSTLLVSNTTGWKRPPSGCPIETAGMPFISEPSMYDLVPCAKKLRTSARRGALEVLPQLPCTHSAWWNAAWPAWVARSARLAKGAAEVSHARDGRSLVTLGLSGG